MARNKLRIPIILKLFLTKPSALLKFLNEDDLYNCNTLYENWDEITEKWLEYPDLRFGQLLINLGYAKDGEIWYIEEDDWLIENKYLKPEEIKFWASIFDKNNKLLKVVQYRLLKDLETDHIKAILKYFNNNGRINDQYLKYFKKRIKKDDTKESKIN